MGRLAYDTRLAYSQCKITPPTYCFVYVIDPGHVRNRVLCGDPCCRCPTLEFIHERFELIPITANELVNLTLRMSKWNLRRPPLLTLSACLRRLVHLLRARLRALALRLHFNIMIQRRRDKIHHTQLAAFALGDEEDRREARDDAEHRRLAVVRSDGRSDVAREGERGGHGGVDRRRAAVLRWDEVERRGGDDGERLGADDEAGAVH